MFALRQWGIFTFDITTAFLHAIFNPDDLPIFDLPPEEYFLNQALVWKLKRAVYGLRTGPPEWQTFFAEEFQKWRFRRFKSVFKRLCSHNTN